jgi:hypothetical protein
MLPTLALLSPVGGAVLGIALRHRPGSQLAVAALAPALSLLALAVAFLWPGPVHTCSSFTTVGGTESETCGSLPLAAAFSWPLTYLVVGALVLLSAAPLVSVWLRSWLPAGASAFLQFVVLILSFGGLFFWVPALVITVAIAFSRPGSTRSPWVSAG